MASMPLPRPPWPAPIGHATPTGAGQRPRAARRGARFGRGPVLPGGAGAVHCGVGGHVHSFHTPVCEAVEIKKYLVEHLGVPNAAVSIESHTRHTTTNLHNTARLLEINKFQTPTPYSS